LSVTDLRSVLAPSGGSGYDRHAASYDQDTGHFNDFREQAVTALRLRPGDTVLDAGCGTGLCFPWIQDRIGPSGKLIVVEPSREMLDKAMQRVAQRRWDNVIPINAAATEFDVTLSVDAVLFCATHDVLRSPTALANVFRHVRPGARLAATGGKWAAPWLWPLNLLVFQLHAPYVNSFTGFDRPWRNLQAYCRDLHVRRIGWDTGFVATGTTATTLTTDTYAGQPAPPRHPPDAERVCGSRSGVDLPEPLTPGTRGIRTARADYARTRGTGVDPGLWRGRRRRGSLECGARGAGGAGSVKLQEVTE
jgi:ubiquinone/menaquinone biosynthesis C-methylase UbiE